MLDFQKMDADTGIADIDSIQPITNIEPADGPHLSRAPQNIRNRTEVLRKAVDELRAIVSLDRAMTILATPTTTVAWGGAADVDLGSGLGTGIPTLVAPAGAGTLAESCIAMQSLMSNSKRLDASGNWVIGDTAIMPKLARTDSGETLTFTSLKRPWENGNNIFVRLYDAGVAQSPKAIATVEGTLDGSGNPVGPVTIHISLSNGGSGIDATHEDVENAISGTAATLIAVTSSQDPGPYTALAFEITDAVDVTKGVPLEGGVDSESFMILASDWNAWLTASPLNEGDVLAFVFADAETRRSKGGSAIGSSTLRTLRESEIVDNANVVPIAKVIQDTLIFSNGTTVNRGETVRLVPDQNLRWELAVDTGTPGDTLVGADAKVSGTGNLVQGTVASQMTSLLGQYAGLQVDYDAHVAGSADKHSLKDIDNKVIATVGANGDYTDLAAAITAVAASAAGGIVLVNPGAYTINLDIASLAGDVRVIGTGVGSLTGGVQVHPDTLTSPAIQVSDTTPDGNLVFENIQFRGNSNSNVEILKFPYFGGKTSVQFKNCYFYKRSGSTTHEFIECGCSALFEDCYIINNTSAEDLPFFVGYAPTGENARPNFTFSRCRFSSWGQLIRLGGSGEAIAGSLVFLDNEISGCGNTSGVSSPGLLIATESGYVAQVNISGNKWLYDSGQAANENGRFCSIKGEGLISNNYLTNGVRYASLTSGFACIRGEGVGHLTIVDNHIEGYDAGCVEADDNCVVTRNYLKVSNNESEMPAVNIVGNDVVVSDNEIDFTSSIAVSETLAAVSTATANVSKIIIKGNNIDLGSNAYHIGILVSDFAAANVTSDVVVDGNTITGSQNEYGIAVTGNGCEYVTVVNNIVKQSKTGIYATDGTFVVINNNIVHLRNISSAKGISTVTATRASIVGNVIYGNLAASEIGVQCDPLNTGVPIVVVAGNAVINCSTDFDVGSKCGIGSIAGSVDSTHNLYS